MLADKFDLRKKPTINLNKEPDNFPVTRAQKAKTKSALQRFNIPDTTEAADNLVPVGFGFYASPDKPVDPTDCDNYPDSPWCGGNPFTLKPIALEPTIVIDECNIGIQLDGVFGFVKLPPIQIVFRNPDCQPEPPPPPPELPLAPNNNCARNVCADGRVITTAWKKGSDIGLESYLVADQHPHRGQYHLDAQEISNEQFNISDQLLNHTWGGDIPAFISNLTITIDSVGDAYNRSRGAEIFPNGYEPNLRNNPLFEVSTKTGNEIAFSADTFTMNSYGDHVGNIEYKRFFYRVEYSIPDYPYQGVQIGLWTVTRFKENLCKINPEPPPPPPPPKECKCMPCCPDSKPNDDALLKLILKRIGSLPAKVPDNFTKQNPAMINIESLAELALWQMQQLDALMGSYPIEIKIDDIDLVKEGDQAGKMTLPNQAEVLAEMLGLMVTIKRETQATLITAIKAMTEAGMGKKISQIGLDVGLANAEYLGYKLEQREQEMKMLFTPGGTKLSDALKEGKIKYVTYENVDKADIQDDLKILKTMAARWNAQNWRKVGEDAAASLKEMLLGNPDAIKGENEKQKQPDFNDFTEQAERGFIEITGISDTVNPWGRPYDQRPKIREIGQEGGRYDNEGKIKPKK